ncbi:MAG: diguanylate cyclase [Ruminococcus flavefaciens]|nr:diguanylate cyclase [Ruminococcus flavefaciens]
MKRIWEFFENMDEYVYVTDIDKYELLYMNKKTLEAFGFRSLEEALGKKCYEVLQRSSTPCAICNNRELCQGEFREWSYYNPILNKHLMIKDTITEYEGRNCRIEFALDVSFQERQNDIIHDYSNLEMMISEGLQMASRAHTPDQSLEIVLEYLGKALHGERTYIFEKNKDGGDDNTYEWVAKGVAPQMDTLQNVPEEVCANWYKSFREKKHIIMENLEDIRESDPLLYVNLKRQDIQSIVVVPLYEDRKVIGFYGIDNPAGGSREHMSDMLQIMAYYILSLMKMRNLMRELEQMSYCDQLTKFGNRYAMEDYTDQVEEDEKLGIVYCDVTGLKRVNDNEGHKAGDRYIVRACECLRRAFRPHGMFRIGGDELLILCRGIEEKDLDERVAALQEYLRESSVVMAVGKVWAENSREGINPMINRAEKLMYEDKAAYYRQSGIDRRR